MEEATGATRVDISANGHSFANNGTVSQTTGLIGNAAGFPGTAGNYLSNASAFIASGAFSVSLWVNATVFPTGANFWAQGNGSTANQFLGVFTTGRVKAIGFSASAGTGTALAFTTTMPSTGTWHHIVGVFDGATTADLYIDGVYVATYGVGSFAAGSTQQVIGSDMTGGVSVLTGSIDLVGIYSRALSNGGITLGQTAGGEIAQLYNSGAGYNAYPGVTMPTLSVTDNGNGTGATVTISGGGSSAINAIYQQAVTGQVGGGNFVQVATIVGNNSTQVAGLGFFWWVAIATDIGGQATSNLVYLNSTNQQEAVSIRLWDSIVATINALNFTNAVGVPVQVARVNMKEKNWQPPSLPCVLVLMDGESPTDISTFTATDQTGYPYVVMFLDNIAGGKLSEAQVNAFQKFEQSVLRTFRGQRVPGVVECMNVQKIEYRPLLARIQASVSHCVGAFLLRVQAREIRGFGT